MINFHVEILMWSTRKVLFPVFKCFVRLWGGYDIVGCYFSGVGMSCFLLQSAIPALAKHLLRPTVLILAFIPFNLIFLISFFQESTLRSLSIPGGRKVAAASWGNGNGNCPLAGMGCSLRVFPSFYNASLHPPWDQKGDLLSQRARRQQGEVSS